MHVMLLFHNHFHQKDESVLLIDWFICLD